MNLKRNDYHSGLTLGFAKIPLELIQSRLSSALAASSLLPCTMTERHRTEAAYVHSTKNPISSVLQSLDLPTNNQQPQPMSSPTSSTNLRSQLFISSDSSIPSSLLGLKRNRTLKQQQQHQQQLSQPHSNEGRTRPVSNPYLKNPLLRVKLKSISSSTHQVIAASQSSSNSSTSTALSTSSEAPKTIGPSPLAQQQQQQQVSPFIDIDIFRQQLRKNEAASGGVSIQPFSLQNSARPCSKHVRPAGTLITNSSRPSLATFEPINFTSKRGTSSTTNLKSFQRPPSPTTQAYNNPGCFSQTQFRLVRTNTKKPQAKFQSMDMLKSSINDLNTQPQCTERGESDKQSTDQMNNSTVLMAKSTKQFETIESAIFRTEIKSFKRPAQITGIASKRLSMPNAIGVSTLPDFDSKYTMTSRASFSNRSPTPSIKQRCKPVLAHSDKNVKSSKDISPFSSQMTIDHHLLENLINQQPISEIEIINTNHHLNINGNYSSTNITHNPEFRATSIRMLKPHCKHNDTFDSQDEDLFNYTEQQKVSSYGWRQ